MPGHPLSCTYVLNVIGAVALVDQDGDSSAHQAALRRSGVAASLGRANIRGGGAGICGVTRVL
jgi:hypothetical protein